MRQLDNCTWNSHVRPVTLSRWEAILDHSRRGKWLVDFYSNYFEYLIKIFKVEYVDGGIGYTCEATNDAGTGSASINVKVIQKPAIKIAEKNEGGGLDKVSLFENHKYSQNLVIKDHTSI